MSRIAEHDHTPAAGALSERDRQALQHLAAGRSTTQIARAMSVSTNTVRTRLRRIRHKLAAGDRDQLVSAARELGLA